MSLRERLLAKKFPIGYESISPQGPDVEERIIKLAKRKFISNIEAIGFYNNPKDNPRISSLAYCALVKNYFESQGIDIETIANVRIRDLTTTTVQSELWGAHALGVRNLLIVTGDRPSSVNLINPLEAIFAIKNYLNKGFKFPTLTGNCIKGINRYLNEEKYSPIGLEEATAPTNFCIGAAIVPNRPNEWEYIKQKNKTNPDFYITQITFTTEDIIRLFSQLNENDVEIDVPVLIGTCPIISEDSLKRIKSLEHVIVPEKICKRLKAANFSSESVEICTEFYAELKDIAQDFNTKFGAQVMATGAPVSAGKIIQRLADG